jgi:hypothetical protein
MLQRWLIFGLLFGFAPACGGSSSETPPPLEPSPSKLAAPPRTAGSAGSEAADESIDSAERAPKSERAPSTTGEPASDDEGPKF